MGVSNSEDGSLSSDSSSRDDSSEAEIPPLKVDGLSGAVPGTSKGHLTAPVSLIGTKRPGLLPLSGVIASKQVAVEGSVLCSTSNIGRESAGSPSEGGEVGQGTIFGGLRTDIDTMQQQMGRLLQAEAADGASDDTKERSDWGDFVG